MDPVHDRRAKWSIRSNPSNNQVADSSPDGQRKPDTSDPIRASQQEPEHNDDNYLDDFHKPLVLFTDAKCRPGIVHQTEFDDTTKKRCCSTAEVRLGPDGRGKINDNGDENNDRQRKPSSRP